MYLYTYNYIYTYVYLCIYQIYIHRGKPNLNPQPRVTALEPSHAPPHPPSQGVGTGRTCSDS